MASFVKAVLTAFALYRQSLAAAEEPAQPRSEGNGAFLTRSDLIELNFTYTELQGLSTKPCSQCSPCKKCVTCKSCIGHESDSACISKCSSCLSCEPCSHCAFFSSVDSQSEVTAPAPAQVPAVEEKPFLTRSDLLELNFTYTELQGLSTKPCSQCSPCKKCASCKSCIGHETDSACISKCSLCLSCEPCAHCTFFSSVDSQSEVTAPAPAQVPAVEEKPFLSRSDLLELNFTYTELQGLSTKPCSQCSPCKKCATCKSCIGHESDSACISKCSSCLSCEPCAHCTFFRTVDSQSEVTAPAPAQVPAVEEKPFLTRSDLLELNFTYTELQGLSTKPCSQCSPCKKCVTCKSCIGHESDSACISKCSSCLSCEPCAHCAFFSSVDFQSEVTAPAPAQVPAVEEKPFLTRSDLMELNFTFKELQGLSTKPCSQCSPCKKCASCKSCIGHESDSACISRCSSCLSCEPCSPCLR
jgi:methionine-rich copper-binding protein CopC